ncbi:glycosyltransferase [Nocardia sp. NPDC127579]|uniref:glycosyltransferase n=1 Tax=Nocardia sp. NPDC127579 TaxID=3345402 RepID=UPI0036417234
MPNTPVHRREIDSRPRILREWPSEAADEIAYGFTRRYPDMAARSGFARWQRLTVVVVVVGISITVALAPLVALVLLAALVTGFSLLNAVVACAGTRRDRIEVAPLPEVELPHYTVLVPAYDESTVIADLVRHLAELDYPHDRLEVLILVERHDPATARAALSADPPAFVRIVELPPGEPRTKPRSVNMGLRLARGELLVIFDAEDRPELDQLRRIAARFAAADDRLAVVQAQLFYDNGDRNWLTRQFAMEYALRFGLLMPGMLRLGLPIPLGGTSNHFRTAILRTLGGWDAWNVTEDADIGMRCAALGYRVEMSDTITWEPAVHTASGFVRQRTRWLKGFLMTTVVHTRHPGRTWRRFGGAGLVSLLGMIASAPVTAIAQPILLALDLLAVTGLAWSPTGAAWVLPAIGAQVASIVGWIVITYTGAARVGQASWQAVFVPLYGSVLWWIAGWRAAHQLVVSPYSWDKTAH